MRYQVVLFFFYISKKILHCFFYKKIRIVKLTNVYKKSKQKDFIFNKNKIYKNVSITLKNKQNLYITINNKIYL